MKLVLLVIAFLFSFKSYAGYHEVADQVRQAKKINITDIQAAYKCDIFDSDNHYTEQNYNFFFADQKKGVVRHFGDKSACDKEYCESHEVQDFALSKDGVLKATGDLKTSTEFGIDSKNNYRPVFKKYGNDLVGYSPVKKLFSSKVDMAAVWYCKPM